jgi:hypothetical protein
MIPVTSLWHFFRLLREFSTDLQLGMAREMDRRPERLDQLIQESFEHFSLYDNSEENFHNRAGDRHPHLLPAYAQANDPANQFAALVGQHGIAVDKHPELMCEYIDYEITPCRTTRSMHESGRNGYGPGGDCLDLLLRNEQFPVVAEVKARNDKNPFVALIQGLMYVVSTSTEAQRRRLKNAYPKKFNWPTDGPYTDLYLILLDYKQDPKSKDFLVFTESIAEKLLQAGCHTAKIIRRIVCLGTQAIPQAVLHSSLYFCKGPNA